MFWLVGTEIYKKISIYKWGVLYNIILVKNGFIAILIVRFCIYKLAQYGIVATFRIVTYSKDIDHNTSYKSI